MSRLANDDPEGGTSFAFSVMQVFKQLLMSAVTPSSADGDVDATHVSLDVFRAPMLSTPDNRTYCCLSIAPGKCSLHVAAARAVPTVNHMSQRAAVLRDPVRRVERLQR
ncbi:hypothetical protein ACG7TL_002047 [Trametes sanguinea]